MGRTATNPVYKYFKYNVSTNTSVCIVDNCKQTVKGKHGTNLETHLSTNHPDEFTKVKMEKESRKRRIEGADGTKRKKSKMEKLKEECVKLVTVHGRPFSLIDDKAFRNIVGMIPLESGTKLAINSHLIRKSVSTIAQQIRDKIRKEISEKLICLKIDAATCMERSFLGINIQFLDENLKLVLRTLAVKELYGSHDAATLKDVVLHVCKDYNISVNNIFSVTTDNGSNMLKLVRLIEHDQNETLDITWDESKDPSFHFDYDSNDNRYIVRCIRCAAHTLQLAVNDALKETPFANIIDKARSVCRKLRTPTVRGLLKAMKQRKPILDCITRWHSTLDMLQRLLELKSFCVESDENLHLSTEEWSSIESIINSLMPARIATKQLQEEHLGIGDFYRVWTNCKLQTDKIKTELSENLLKAMTKRQTMLFNNDLFLAGLFLDARYNITLTPEESERAQRYLLNMWEHILRKEPRLSITNVNCTRSNHNEDSDTDEVEKMMMQLEREKRNPTPISTSINLKDILKTFSQLPRLKSKDSIFDFWRKNKNCMPELYKIAATVLAVPSTQVSVERLFSSLKYILSYHRYNLRDDCVNDILLIRTNSE